MNFARAGLFFFFALLSFSSAFAQGKPGVLTVTPLLSHSSAKPGDKLELKLRLKIQAPYHINSNPASEEYLIPVEAKIESPDVQTSAPIYPKGELKKFVFATKPLSVYEGETEIRVPLEVKKSAGNGMRKISGIVKYQACNDKACLIPAKVAFAVPLKINGGAGNASSTPQATTSTPATSGVDPFTSQLRNRYAVIGLPAIVFVDAQGNERKDLRAGEELVGQGRDVFLQKIDALKTGATWSQREGAGGWLERLQNAPLWSQLILVFLGGLLLNLTPCVYPMIPITIGFFGAQTENKASGRALLASLYVLGLALVYSLLGVTAALTGKLFGAALQSPLVPGFLAIVLLLLALSMFGLFTIQPPQFILQKSGAKRGAVGALAMGALLGFVAAPCVGPVVVALLTYVGTKQNPFLGFILFFVLSLGLGVPYLLLGMFSGAIKSLPKSGAWLERLKKIFAVPLLIAGAYYAYIAFNGLQVSRAASTASHWPEASTQTLEAARREGKPVVLDFRADWCLPCLQLEREIFSTPEVLARQKDAILLRVDLTRAEG